MYLFHWITNPTHLTMQIESVFDTFCAELEKREGIITEDNIRYYWFASMLNEDDQLNHYTLEYPYSEQCGDLQNEELDMLYQSDDETWCFEMKFHRNGESESTYAHTDAAGSLFNDLLRLQALKQNAKWKNARYFFLYVTDSEMYNYLTAGKECKGGLNKEYRAKLKEFIELDAGQELSIDFRNIEDVPKTFIGSALTSFVKDASLEHKDKIQIRRILLNRKQDNIQSQSPSLKEDNESKFCYARLYEIL